MKTDQFDDLLVKLPKIAEAVNAFSSEEVQRQVFQTLITTLGVKPAADPKRVTATPASADNQVEDDAPVKPARKAIRKAKTASAKIPERLQSIELQTSMEGYPDFHTLGKKADKLLWVLQFAQANGLASLSNAEIVILSDRLGDGIPGTDINGYYKANLKKTYVNRSLQDKTMRILPQGSTYLAGLVQKAE